MNEAAWLQGDVIRCEAVIRYPEITESNRIFFLRCFIQAMLDFVADFGEKLHVSKPDYDFESIQVS